MPLRRGTESSAWLSRALVTVQGTAAQRRMKNKRALFSLFELKLLEIKELDGENKVRMRPVLWAAAAEPRAGARCGGAAR